MKLYNLILYFVLLSAMLSFITNLNLKNNEKKSFNRADLIREENDYAFKAFKFKESESGWGDVFKSDGEKNIDPFTGAVLKTVKQGVKLVDKASKKIANGVKKFFHGDDNKDGDNEKLERKNAMNGVVNNDENYGPLIRPNKKGIIYGQEAEGSWGGNWETGKPISQENSEDAKYAAPNNPAREGYHASTPRTAAHTATGSAAAASASASASASSSQEESSASASSAAAASSSGAAVGGILSPAEQIKKSGMNGGGNLDANAAGNTPLTDHYGNSLADNSMSNEGNSKSSNQSFSISGPASSQGVYARTFECPKDKIIKAIDPRYRIIKLMDHLVNDDNSVRFFSVDTTNDKTVALKLFFKGMPHNCEFYNQLDDKNYEDTGRDCLNNQVINNRLYKLPKDYKGTYEKYKGKEIFNDVLFPWCKSNNSKAGGISTFYQVYDLPDGENLKRKCLLDLKLDNTNSCIPFLRTIARGTLHGLEVLNSGNKFFAHGNLIPQNMYLKMWSGESKVFLDNLKYESSSYDDKNNKPAVHDMDMLGDTLLHLLIGTDNKEAIQFPIKDSFDLYVKVKEYLRNSGIDLNIKSSALNVPLDIDANNAKVVTKEEYLAKLSKSIFDFIYRLKNTNVSPNNQFEAPSQALKHDFLQAYSAPIVTSSGEVLRDTDNSRSLEALGSAPSDY